MSSSLAVTVRGISDHLIAGQTAVVESMKNIFEQRKIPASIAEKDVHSLASVLKVKQIT